MGVGVRDVFKVRVNTFQYILFFVLLVLYPLRGINIGVDLWDGGYNYANFRYSGTEYMDSMWYFATWTATEAGAWMMRLPFAGTMSVMNLYTGAVVSLLAAAGFLFCTKVLRMPPWMVFVGEVTACGLCWLPTSALYNYLTFLFLMLGTILLYQGLVKGKDGYLAAAGVMLGINVGVRFSNLVQTGLILAVWGYGLLKRKGWRKICRQTLMCVGGYAGALGIFLLVMGVKYGLRNYFDSIFRLFAMTEVADDYSPSSMLTSALKIYFGDGYWIKRFGLALAVGTGICLIAPQRAVRVKKFLCVGVVGGLFCWLLTHRFYYPDFATYQSIYDPCIMLLLLSLVLSFLFLIKRDVTEEDKLLALIEILLILLTSLGGNNVIFYNINNMFLTLPILFYMLWKLWRNQGDTALFPWKLTVTALALLVCVLAFCFGHTFSYEEATGGRSMNYVIKEIPVLRGMRTGREKGEALTELYAFLEENGLRDRSCILYGQIPGISYYMGLKPAFNIWSDLRSYTFDVMANDLDKTGRAIEDGAQEPVVILEAAWADYISGGREADALWEETAVEKAELLKEFMVRYGYVRVYENGRFVLYEKGGDCSEGAL